jgi:hypothetical protein
LTQGHRTFPKERIEVFAGGSVFQIDNWRTLKGFGVSRSKSKRLWMQDKGHSLCMKTFLDAVRTGGPSPQDLQMLDQVSRATLKVAELAEQGGGSAECMAITGSLEVPAANRA